MYIAIQKNILSVIILAILYISLIRRVNWKEKLNKAFSYLILFNIAIILFDSIIIITTGNNVLIAKILMFVSVGFYYALAPVGAFIWLIYADIAIFQDKNRLYKLSIIPTFLILVNLVGVILSYSQGLMFNISQENIFFEGDHSLITFIISASVMLYAMFHIYINRNLIRKYEYLPLIIFAIPPLVSSIIYIFFNDANFIWNSLVISQLLIYIYIQSKITSTDFLTGLFNKREYEFLIKSLAANKPENIELSAIAIDINDFKKINDEHGHRTGDEALVTTAKLLKTAVRKQDYVFRVGGDEFVVIVLSDETHILDKVITRIEQGLEAFNQSSAYPFELNYSLGKGNYEYQKYNDLQDFFAYLDSSMYEHKKILKQEIIK